MMGGCCGLGRGSRGRWRKPLRISVHGKGSEGGSVRWRSGGASPVSGERRGTPRPFAAAAPPYTAPSNDCRSQSPQTPLRRVRHNLISARAAAGVSQPCTQYLQLIIVNCVFVILNSQAGLDTFLCNLDQEGYSSANTKCVRAEKREGTILA